MTTEQIEDPDEPPRVRRRRDGRRRVPRTLLIAGAVGVVLVIWAATSVGERPGLGRDTGATPSVPSTAPEVTQDGDDGGDTGDDTDAPPAPDDSGTTFTDDAPVLASAGCEDPVDNGAASDADLTVEGSVLARYSVTAPADNDPAPLLILVSEPGLPVADLATMSAVFDVNPDWVQVGVDPVGEPGRLGEAGIPQLLEETITTRCIDLSRVFVVGFGAGGRSVGAATCAAPRHITGAVMVAGWAEPACSPDPRVAVRMVGSDDDPTTDTGTALEEVGGAWARAVGAGEQTVDGRDEETLVRTWSGPGGVTVETTATVSGGHTWTLAASLATGDFLEGTSRSVDG